MRRAWAPAIALVLLSAPPAAAQAPQPVEGGSSFGTATAIVPGVYTDTIQQREELYFAIELREGQRLEATATVFGQPGPSDPDSQIRLHLSNPLRDPERGGTQARFSGQADARASLQSEVVGDPGFERTGAYFLRVQFADLGAKGLLAGRDYRYQLTVAATQVRAATTTSSPPSTSGPTPTVTTPGAPDRPTEDGGPPVAGAVVSFLAGAAGGGAFVRARRQRGRIAAGGVPGPTGE